LDRGWGGGGFHEYIPSIKKRRAQGNDGCGAMPRRAVRCGGGLRGSPGQGRPS
jgi:hypothetical protein